MAVLKERSLRLSRKKTRIGHIELGFHFLGIHYPGTQTPDNTKVEQAVDRTVIQADIAQYIPLLSGGGQILQRIIKRLRWIVSSHTQGRCGKHASKLSRWLLMGCLPAESELTCIVGPSGG